MMYLRPIEKRDIAALTALAEISTLPTLPHERSLVEQKIQHAVESFMADVVTPGRQLYMFALEDSDPESEKTGIVGVSAIAATTGDESPLYFFRRESLFTTAPIAHIVSEIPLLTPVSYNHGPSELCSLFLHPEYRKHGLGKLLSLGRLHFMAAHGHRFTSSVSADLLGVLEGGESAFWNGIGRHFFDVPISEIYKILNYTSDFISAFLPKHPIYVKLLPESVQSVIGQTHTDTKAALALLQHEGFVVTDEVDIFDGGPRLKCKKEDIHTIKASAEYRVDGLEEVIQGGMQGDVPRCLLSNGRLADFRACMSPCRLDAERHTLTLPKDAAAALRVRVGDIVQCS